MALPRGPRGCFVMLETKTKYKDVYLFGCVIALCGVVAIGVVIGSFMYLFLLLVELVR